MIQKYCWYNNRMYGCAVEFIIDVWNNGSAGMDVGRSVPLSVPVYVFCGLILDAQSKGRLDR